jgi:tRNA modification GTPase
MDLKQKIEKNKILKDFKHAVEISAKSSRNINLLEEAIAELVHKGKISPAEPLLVSNLRHIASLRQAQKVIAEAAKSLDNKLSLEFVAQDIRDALSCLDDILGRSFSEDLLDKIFSEFCIGK